MSQQNFNQATTAISTAQTVHSHATYVQEEKKSGVIDWAYIKGVPAILKYIEEICCLIAYICVQASGYYCVSVATRNYFLFVTISGFALAVALHLILLLKIPQRCLRCNCVNWPFFEMCIYAGILVFFFFGVLFQAIHACIPSHQAGCAFGFFAFFAFIADFTILLIGFIRGRREASSQNNIPVNNPSPDVKY